MLGVTPSKIADAKGRLSTAKRLETRAEKRAKRADKLLLRRRRQVRNARKQLRKLRADRVGPADQAVRWALSQVGTVEQPAFSNWGPRISDWIKASGYTFPVAWCQCFANAAAVHGGCAQLRTGYTPTVMRGMGGYRPIPLSQAKRGDMVFFKWPGVSRDPCDHVGILLELRAGTVVCVEGNTSPSNAGSQNNGGGVFQRERSRSLVAGAVRPPYGGAS